MTDWVVDVVERLGAVGVGLLIFLENVLPPIPSEVILPFTGFAAERGDLNVVAAWVAATAGSLAGALLLYGFGFLIGEDRLYELSRTRWFVFFGEKDLDRGLKFFDRHGTQVVFFARFVPLLRSIVSVPAGMDRMPLSTFLGLTAVGSAIWNGAFIALGWVLGDRWEDVERWVAPVGQAVLVVLVLVGAWLLVRKLRQRGGA